MAKPHKVPRPTKPPILPPRLGQIADPTIGLIQEKLIGRAIVEWSKLEACLEDSIWRLLDVEIEIGRIITARLDATAKIRMLRELGERLLPQPEWHELSQIVDRIDIRREDRNFIGHGTWGRSLPENIPVALSLRVKPNEPTEVVSETFSEDRMKEIIGDIQSLKWSLIRLLKLQRDAAPERPAEA